MDLHAFINFGFKIAISILLIMLIFGVITIFHEFWIGIATIIFSAILLALTIISFRLYRRDKKTYLKLHIRAIAWRDFAALLFFSLFFLFIAATSFYGGDNEAAILFFSLFVSFLFLAVIIGWQNKRLRI